VVWPGKLRGWGYLHCRKVAVPLPDNYTWPDFIEQVRDVPGAVVHVAQGTGK